jgi:hypothetical protein
MRLLSGDSVGAGRWGCWISRPKATITEGGSDGYLPAAGERVGSRRSRTSEAPQDEVDVDLAKIPVLPVERDLDTRFGEEEIEILRPGERPGRTNPRIGSRTAVNLRFEDRRTRIPLG